MKARYLCLVLIFVSGKSFGQVDPLGAFNRHRIANWEGEYIHVGQYRVKGTPYLLGESFPGFIVYKSGKALTNTKILYDLYDQKAGVDVDSKMFESDDAVDEFMIALPEKFGGQKLLFVVSDTFGSSAGKGFLNVLQDGGKATLLKAYRIKLIPDPTNTMANDIKIFEQYYEHYIYTKTDKTLHKIKLKEKEIIKELGNDQKLKDYIKANDIDLSKEPDLIKLIRNYNDM